MWVREWMECVFCDVQWWRPVQNAFPALAPADACLVRCKVGKIKHGHPEVISVNSYCLYFYSRVSFLKKHQALTNGHILGLSTTVYQLKWHKQRCCRDCYPMWGSLPLHHFPVASSVSIVTFSASPLPTHPSPATCRKCSDGGCSAIVACVAH